MNSQTTAIIGGGIVGLYLAGKICELGYKVTLFEKKGEIGKLACSGLFSEEILNFFPESRSLVQNRIKSALIHFPKRSVRVSFRKDFLVMNHAKLDRLAAKKAEESGAEIILNRPIESLPAGFDRVIGCDGANSTVRKELQLKSPDCRLGMLGFVEKRDCSDFVEAWAVKKGFIWRVPRGERTEYGVLAELNEAGPVLEDFLKKRNIILSEKRSALIPQGLVITQNRKAALCGDAAGLTKPWSGGGVIWGLTAARMLVDSFPDFSEYEKRLKKRFKLKIFILKRFTGLVYFLGFNFPWILPKHVKIESDAIFTNFIQFTKNR